MTRRSNAAKFIELIMLSLAILFCLVACDEGDSIGQKPNKDIKHADSGEAQIPKPQMNEIDSSYSTTKNEKASFQSAQNRLQSRLSEIIGSRHGGHEVNVDVLDPFTAFFASELAQECGEFLNVPEQLWTKAIMAKVGLSVTSETFKGYVKSLQPETDSLLEIGVNMYGPYVSLEIFRKFTELAARGIAASGVSRSWCAKRLKRASCVHKNASEGHFGGFWWQPVRGFRGDSVPENGNRVHRGSR